uniref:TF-B3 domain-containing protein n=2 Tax=Opuntia streptacantha TaxID=393608 RepID=A0A7C8YPS8_OPUST
MQEEKGKSRGIFNMKGDDELCRFPSFFKLILSARLCLQKLEIPRKFVENHGEKLSDLVYLITPTKAVWKVDVVRKDTRAWLQNGWAEFVKFYSICHGHFLVFRYKGYSHFEVVIFDMSASEIEYPTSSRTGSKRKRATGIPIAPASIKGS